MSVDPCEICDDFDCNLDCGVGFDDPALADCELDTFDCLFDDVCEVDNNCGTNDICNDECGRGDLAACDDDFDCESFLTDSIGFIIAGVLVGILVFVMVTVGIYIQHKRVASLALKPNENSQAYVPPQGEYNPPQGEYVPPQAEGKPVDAWAQ